MGVVYEARDTRDDSRLALKVLLPHAAEEQDGLLRFKREFRALARLHHPNVVRVFDAGLDDDVAFIAMEFLDGVNIRQHLKTFEPGPSRTAELRRCLREIFGALAYIHARRIVHRDLKPENVLVCQDGRVKLMDFGVARLLKSPTSSSGLLGTFAYMAPEQVTGSELDGRADLYAVGVLLFEALVGGYPFPVEPPAAALHHHVNTEPPSILEEAPGADPQLADLCHQLLKKDPLDRVQSAEEALSWLADDGTPPEEVSETGQLFAPRFVGRDQAMIALDRVVEHTAGGAGSVILIEGASGLGKSRVIQELRRRHKQRITVLTGACAPERLHPYQPVQAMLDEVEAIVVRSPADIIAKILGRDGSLVHSISPRLARLAGPASTAHLDPAERRIRLHKAVIGVIGRLALTRPVVLVVEDVHFADSGTREVLWNAVRTFLQPRKDGLPGTVCPVSLVLTRRLLAEGPDHAEELIRRLEERSQLQRIHLGPFAEEEVAFMVRSMTGVDSVAPGPLRALMSLTGGRPMMVSEVLESWSADGTLSRRHGQWLYKDEPLSDQKLVDAGGRAASLRPRIRGPQEDVAQSRLESLSAAARTLVERLALLGKMFPADLVRVVADLEEERFLDAIDELVRSNLMVEDARPHEVRYRFHHEAFRHAVVRSLPDRGVVHRFIARRIERSLRARRRDLAHVLARHFREGGWPARSLRYLEYMVDAAARRGDLEAAVNRIEQAMAIVDERPLGPASSTRRLRLTLRHIDVLLDFGRPREALDRADPEAALDARQPARMQAELLLRRATCQFRLGRLDETLATLTRMPEPPPTRALAAESLALEGRARALRGEYRLAQSVLERARRIAGDGRIERLAERLDGQLGDVLLRQGRYSEAYEYLSAGLERAKERRDTRATAELIGSIGIVRAAQGYEDEALACYREALELADARGVRADLERWSGYLGVLLAEAGDDTSAIHYLDQAVDIAKEVGNRQGEAMWRGELGRAHMNAGRPERAAAELMRSLAIAREVGFALYEGYAQIHLGSLSLDQAYADFGPARRHLEAGLEIAETLSHNELHALALAEMGRVSRAQGDAAQADSWFQEAHQAAMRGQNLRLRSEIRTIVREGTRRSNARDEQRRRSNDAATPKKNHQPPRRAQ